MSGLLQEIGSFMPSFLLKLYQRKLLDPNAEITEEELLEAHSEIAQEIKFIQYKQERLEDKQLMLKRLIERSSLYNSSQGFVNKI